MVMQTTAGVDASGNVLDWDLRFWSTPHGTRPGGEPGNLLSARYLEKPFAMPLPTNGGPPNFAADRNGIALYDFAGHTVQTHFITDMPVRASSTRGRGAYANVFAIESFMDELAVAAKADPLSYRLRFLKDERARDALQQAADRFGWASWKKSAHRGRGWHRLCPGQEHCRRLRRRAGGGGESIRNGRIRAAARRDLGRHRAHRQPGWRQRPD